LVVFPPRWQAAVVNIDETPLVIWGGGTASPKAHLRQDVVLRAAAPWSRSVITLLKLEAVGFEGAPRPVGDGFDADGREAITYIPGSTPHPRAWDDHAISAVGALLRRRHDATESFQPPADAIWQSSFARLLPGHHPVFGHGDTGPWNVVAQGGIPVAFIDWEFAGPVDALWELAETAWLNAQLHDDDIAERAGLPSAARRSQQVRLLLDAYGRDPRPSPSPRRASSPGPPAATTGTRTSTAANGISLKIPRPAHCRRSGPANWQGLRRRRRLAA
jgi:hypothetical protein